jgi:hypothetical protein
VNLLIREKADALKCFSKQLISINCLIAWFVDLKEEGLSLDDVLEACFETFFDPTFAKKSS